MMAFLCTGATLSFLAAVALLNSGLDQWLASKLSITPVPICEPETRFSELSKTQLVTIMIIGKSVAPTWTIASN
jgi:3-mercaptopyruvate sulfurtransferase SseA